MHLAWNRRVLGYLWVVGVLTRTNVVSGGDVELDLQVPDDYCLCERMTVVSGDCCCDYSQVEELNDSVIFPLLHNRLLNGTTFQNFWVGGIGELGECDEARYSPLFPGGVRPQTDYQCMIQTCNIEENLPENCITSPPPETDVGPQSCALSQIVATTSLAGSTAPMIDGWDCAPAWAKKKEYHLPSQMERHTGYEGSHIWHAIHGLASSCATTAGGIAGGVSHWAVVDVVGGGNEKG